MEKIEIGIMDIIERMEENEGCIIIIEDAKEKTIEAKLLLYEFDIEDITKINYILETGDIEILLNSRKILVQML
jgi:hypothetical protein|nr:MAG TPA: hypothetical protein [Caudoviricetes sp.]